MLWILLVVLIIIVIVAISKGNKKKDLEITKLKTEVTSPPSAGIADELKKLKELLDSGAINQEEYDLQKQKLLK
jgi:hypothetical protein